MRKNLSPGPQFLLLLHQAEYLLPKGILEDTKKGGLEQYAKRKIKTQENLSQYIKQFVEEEKQEAVFDLFKPLLKE
ncbi:MAG: hypothetical protein QY314_04805 [Candidatus Dojkabacteria bacterium]|nr:MAG: hypothetical protein QY314_04805 [Candidatus Dojkabacteria bacterium]